jgi:tetratricopeptide (TPR) repeat protein
MTFTRPTATGRLRTTLGTSVMAASLFCVSAARAQSSSATSATAASAGEGAPSNPVSSLSSAEQLYRAGKVSAAEELYKASIASSPDAAPAYAGLARTYLNEKEPAQAYAAAAKAIELAPSNPAAQVTLAEVYFRQGKIAEAQAELMALVRAGTTQPRAYLELGRIYRAASYYKQARQMLDMAHKIDPGDPDVQSEWFGTLTLDERIRSLQEYLAGKDEITDRVGVQRQLALLQEEANYSTRQCRLATKVTAMQTDLKQLFADVKHLRGFGLNVNLNGTSANLLLDTGAGGILVDRKIAEKAGIKRVVETSIGGIGDQGNAAGYTGYADSIKIGDLEFNNCLVGVVEQNSVAGSDGLIGADVFSHFLVDLDFSDGKFRLSELPPWPDQAPPDAALESQKPASPQLHDRYVAPEMKSFAPVLRFGHDLLIATRMNDSAPKWFLIDTGAFNNTISPAAAKEVTKVSSDADTKVKGLSGNVASVFRAYAVTLQFANLKQQNQDTVAFDTTSMSNNVGTEVSGTLGFATLRVLDLKIDYRDGLVNFTYDPNRWGRF